MDPTKNDPSAPVGCDPGYLYELTFGITKTEVLFSAVNLGVFDALKEQPRDAAQMAVSLKVSPKHLDKLLNTCCMLRLLNKVSKGEDEYVYENTLLSSTFLTTGHSQSLVDFVKMNEMFKGLTGRMQKAVETGEQQLTKEDNLFYLFEKKPENRQIFQGAMACISRTSAKVLDVFDLSKFHSSLDVGGGTGTFARLLAERHPHIDVRVLDLQKVVDTAKSVPANANTRVKFVPGDFFVGGLPEAELVSLCHVLHDWDDENSDKILHNVYKAVKPGGALLILDTVLNDDKVGPFRANMTEISQIVQHEGKHRTGAEFTRLVNKAGFQNAQVHQYKGFGFYDAIFCRKPAAVSA